MRRITLIQQAKKCLIVMVLLLYFSEATYNKSDFQTVRDLPRVLPQAIFLLAIYDILQSFFCLWLFLILSIHFDNKSFFVKEFSLKTLETHQRLLTQVQLQLSSLKPPNRTLNNQIDINSTQMDNKLRY
jgi:hypothetical protein